VKGSHRLAHRRWFRAALHVLYPDPGTHHYSVSWVVGPWSDQFPWSSLALTCSMPWTSIGTCACRQATSSI